MPPETSEAWRAFFVGAGRGGGVQPQDLTASGLPEPWRAAVGAAVLPKADLEAHFRRHPTPPDDIGLQGMWVNGRRTAQQGDAAAYETIAATPGLKPTWRLDLWRRAAELRLLDGSEVRARTDLYRARQAIGVDPATVPRGTDRPYNAAAPARGSWRR